MEDEKKIFYSEITRVDFEQKNNFQELLNVTPAIPIPVKTSENETCIFNPRCDKYYVPKKKSRMKVRTVREIRNLFEQDNYSYIIEDMEKQQSALLNKIRTGSATDDSTKNMAKKLLNADHPISRTAWQMLNNINPDKNGNPTQFVLWNSRRIRVVGSKGGKNKFICNHDLGKHNIEKMKKKCCLEKNIKKKSGLLRNSLNIKFKPGPLQRKKDLDDSYQKYHMGPVELVKLPRPALDIQPAYGTVVEPIMSNFLNKLRAENGVITEKWAEFAVSALGKEHNNNIVQIEPERCVTFDISYKCAQDRILMRRDICNVSSNCDNATEQYKLQNESDNILEIQETLSNMLDSVEISIKQDSMYSIENESPQTIPNPIDGLNTDNVKEKSKKKYGELDRLAVTVIQLPAKPKQIPSKPCGKSYCNLGCVCDSLNCTYKFKQHCGHFECMFGCKCELSKYKNIELLENDCADIIPGLMNLDNEINANLAKEEQKFHQTVVVSGEKSILLNSRKRASKSSMKYAEFYSNIQLKNKNIPKKILAIVVKKLNCANLEPWCMIHNLYRCFCKGRFTETSAFNNLPITNVSAEPDNSTAIDHEIGNTNHDIRTVLRPRVRPSRESSEKISNINSLAENNVLRVYDYDNPSDTKSARTDGYIGRKYSDSYYKITNNKILEMEKNDTILHKKMMRIIKNTSLTSSKPLGATPIIFSESSEDTTFEHGSRNEYSDNCSKKTSHKELEIDKKRSKHDAEPSPQVSSIAKFDLSDNSEDSKTSTDPHIPFEISGDIYKPIKGHLVTQEFLTPWIAKSYKNYKEQLNNGKSVLERPKRGRIILHLWECLLSRYKNRRNFFLTTTKRPFRIYIATETWKPFFKDCINIDAIRFADLHKYPSLVKNLLTNASNKDYFCILGGWDDCWEIIGSVKKNESITDDRPSDSDTINTENLFQNSDFAPDNWCVKEQDKMANNPNTDFLRETNETEMQNNNIERSKWFLIKLENDFTEIYCHKKGFYVEREKILHAISLARITHKTIVINKQTCTEITEMPFGIYALPDMTEYCAVVGPYEIDESLGLEIVKANMFVQQNSTKGYWITTNKVDNIKVLNDPLSFLPAKTIQNELSSEVSANAVNSSNISNDTDNSQSSTSQQNDKNSKKVQSQDGLHEYIVNKKIPKLVKPIKIRRTNGFYHLTSNNNLVKKISPNTATSVMNVKRMEINTQKQILKTDPIPLVIANDSNYQIKSSEEIDEPITYIINKPSDELPQIKITSVYSESDTTDKGKNKDKKLGMFILKPEEINKKILDCNYQTKYIDGKQAIDEMSIDIEHFLGSSGDSSSISKNDVFLISDNEEDTTQKWTKVGIQCISIKKLGWIRARRNEKNLLNIQFPGFDLKKLYNQSEAFDKINEVLSTKINIPEHIKLKWKVVHRSQASKSHKVALLNAKSLEIFAKKYEITEKGLLGTKKSINKEPTSTFRLFEDLPEDITDTSTDLIEGLEETSRLLENESALLWNETEKRETEIMQTLKVPEELRSEMSETLQSLMTMNDDLVDD